MEQLLKTWKLRMVKYRQEADNANSPITCVKAMNKFFMLRDCIKELEEQLTIHSVVVSDCLGVKVDKSKATVKKEIRDTVFRKGSSLNNN